MSFIHSSGSCFDCDTAACRGGLRPAEAGMRYLEADYSAVVREPECE